MRIRGNAYQVNEKYQALARDASATGDRVMAENYLQHAEHYYRIINAMNEAHSQTQQPYDGASRDGVARDGNGRDNGQRGAPRDDGPPRDRAVVRPDPAPSDPREVDSDQGMEFGEDPRQPDAREQRADDANGEAPADLSDGVEVVTPSEPPVEQPPVVAVDGANGRPSPAAKPRRRPGRPRKTVVDPSKDEGAETPAATNPDGD